MQLYSRYLSFIITVIAGISITSTSAFANTLSLKPYSASYRGEAMGMSKLDFGSRRLEQLSNNQYRFSSEAEAFIYEAKESSEFNWNGQQVTPQSYQSETSNLFKNRKNSLRFNHAKSTISYRYKDKEGSLTLKPGAQDPLTSLITLAAEISQGKTQIQFPEAKGRKLKSRHFELLGTPTIHTEKAGNIKTYHLILRDSDPERQTEIWLHHEHPYIAVRIKQKDEGDQFLLELTDFSLH